MFSLVIVGRDLFLAQSSVLDFVDFCGKSYLSMEWLVDGIREGEGKVEGVGRGAEWEINLACKIRKGSFFKKIKKIPFKFLIKKRNQY